MGFIFWGRFCFVLFLVIALILIAWGFYWIQYNVFTKSSPEIRTNFVLNYTHLEDGINLNSLKLLDKVSNDFTPLHHVPTQLTHNLHSTSTLVSHLYRKKFLHLTLNLELLANRTNVRLTRTPEETTFLARIAKFCTDIYEERQKILSRRGSKPWQDVEQPEKLSVIWGRDDDFLGKLVSREDIQLIIFPWENSDFSNTLITEYYQWTASSTLCEWIRAPGLTKAHWDAVYNRSCEEDLETSSKPRGLEPMYFYGKPINKLHYWPNYGQRYPNYFYTHYPDAPLYLTIIQDGIVNLVGDVISGDTKIVPYTCSHDSIPTYPKEYPESPIFKEVFVVTQFWGETSFHRMIEVLPRFMPYLSFLKENPSIAIHAPKDRDMLSDIMKILGLNSERIVTGILRSKVIYLPQGTPCGFPHVQSLQLMSYHLRTFVSNTKLTGDLSNATNNRLVLIKRSGSRRFLRQRDMEVAISEFSVKHGLNFYIFSDKAIPGLVETMSIFNSALIVVAPHGAGLANLAFSQPGTLVIEGICNPPHVNMCYQFVAHVLGHRYHGIPSISGCESYINIDPQEVIKVLEQFISLKIIKFKY